jgi:hypothetical protein
VQGLEKLVGAAGWCGWERWQVQMQAHHHHQFLVQPGRGGGGREGRQSVCSGAKVQVGGPECAGQDAARCPWGPQPQLGGGRAWKRGHEGAHCVGRGYHDLGMLPGGGAGGRRAKAVARLAQLAWCGIQRSRCGSTWGECG